MMVEEKVASLVVMRDSTKDKRKVEKWDSEMGMKKVDAAAELMVGE
jgi:hypothetical protein